MTIQEKLAVLREKMKENNMDYLHDSDRRFSPVRVCR